MRPVIRINKSFLNHR